MGCFFRLAIVTLLSLSASGCFLSYSSSLLGRQRTPLKERVLSGRGDAKVLVVPISGEITSYEKSSGLLGLFKEPSTVVKLRAILRKAEKDEDIRAVILRINSPGGSVTASDVAYRMIADYKKKRRVEVVAYLMDVAASGGYYIAVAADKVVAHPTTVTGSIGVIMLGLNFSGLMEKIGVGNATVKSGKFKDMGSPLRPWKEDERRIIQSVIDELHERFKDVVAQGRPRLGRADVDRLADGRIYSAKQALKEKLIDKIGDFDDALATAKELAGVSEARVIIYRNFKEHPDDNVYARLPRSLGPPQINLVNIDAGSLFSTPSPRFMYLWAPDLGGLAASGDR